MKKVIKQVTDEMVQVPGGNVTLRDDRINRSWSVAIKPFLLAKYPVTQSLYYQVTDQSPSMFPGEDNPVENVSWRDAIIFCNQLSIVNDLEPFYTLNENGSIRYDSNSDGFRLSFEAEWQYACKAGTNGVRYGEIDEIAWYKNNSGKTTHKVGMKNPNPWGLYDMLGNVWEWCSDLYDETVYGSYRIFRGGGWCDEERSCMATNRRRSHPNDFRIDDLGFRIARSII